jgi:hypothetical protein
VGFVIFLLLLSIFGLNNPQIFKILNFIEFLSHNPHLPHCSYSRPLLPPPISQRKLFLIRPVLSYLSVASATWQYCGVKNQCCQLAECSAA